MILPTTGFWNGKLELPTQDLIQYNDAKLDSYYNGIWEDQTLNNNIWRQNVINRRPILDSESLIFSGDKYLDAIGAYGKHNITESTWFCVFKTISLDTQVIFSPSYDGFPYNPVFYILGNSVIFGMRSAALDIIQIISQINLNQTYLICGIYNKPDTDMYLDGNYIGSSTGANLDLGLYNSSRLGSRANGINNQFKGSISSFLWYNKALSLAKINKINNYLKARFNI